MKFNKILIEYEVILRLFLKDISSEEALKQKTQIILEVYLDSAIPPAVQIDIQHEAHQKLIKALAKMMQNTHASSDFLAFEEVKSALFKDLLPYWSGYKQACKRSEISTLTKVEKSLKERFEEFFSVRSFTPNDFKLPPLSAKHKNANQTNSHSQIVFSLTNGIKYKDEKHIPLNAQTTNLTAEPSN